MYMYTVVLSCCLGCWSVFIMMYILFSLHYMYMNDNLICEDVQCAMYIIIHVLYM